MPPLVFELARDEQNFEVKFGRFAPKAEGAVLAELLRIEDSLLTPDILNDLFEFDTTYLKRQAACSSIELETQQIMAPKMASVFRGVTN